MLRLTIYYIESCAQDQSVITLHSQMGYRNEVYINGKLFVGEFCKNYSLLTAVIDLLIKKTLWFFTKSVLLFMFLIVRPYETFCIYCNTARKKTLVAQLIHIIYNYIQL